MTIELPRNLQAETAVLGSLLFDNGLAEYIADLKPDHFFDPVHARTYQRIVAMIRAGRIADGVSLKKWAQNDEGMLEAGGHLYLLHLMEIGSHTISTQARGYAAILRDLAIRRGIIKACAAAATMAANLPEEQSAADALAEAERLLHAIDSGANEAISLRDAAGLAIENAEKGDVGIRTGLASIDKLIGGLYAPDLIVLAGRPSMGKTSLAANIGHGIAHRDYVVHFASCEMSAEQIAQRALSRASHGGEGAFPYRGFRRGGVDLDLARSLASRLPENFVIDETGAQTLSHLSASARTTRRRFGRIDLLIVDYLQLMRDDAIRRGETAEITALTKGLKLLAKDLGVPIICLSQLSREVEKRNDKRPQLSDLRQSGSIEQDADVVLFAFREHYYLSRSEPRPEDNEKPVDFDLRYHKWAERCEETSGRMEVIAAKTRMDETGSNYLLVDLAFDTASDPPGQAPHHSSYLRGAP